MELAKKKFGLRRILSVLLCLSMLLSPVVTLADSVIGDGTQSMAEPELTLIQSADQKTVYKLVENYTVADISTSKTYMIVSTDVPGEEAFAFGSKGKDRYFETVGGMSAFEVPVATSELEAGTYITNAFPKASYGEWKFEKVDDYYRLYTTTVKDGKDVAGYIGTHPNGGLKPDGNLGGYHPGHFILLYESELTWTRLCKLRIAEDNVDLSGFRFTYSNSDGEKPYGVTAGGTGYLSYGPYTGVYREMDGDTIKVNVNTDRVDFNLVTGGSAKTRIQLYEKVGERAIPEIKGYLYSKEGAVAVGTGKFAPTGAYIHLYVDGELTRVPVTTDMLSGADLTKAGTYVNVKVSYNGVELADDFTLEVKAVKELVVNNYNEAGKNSSFFVLADPDQNNSFVEGGYIHIAETQTPGYVRLLTTDGTNLGSTEYYAYEIFVDGERQLVIDAASANSIWVTNSVKHDSIPDAKFWNLRAFLYGEKYLNFNDSSDLGQSSALTVNTVKNSWTAKWHERNEMTGIALYNPDGSIVTSDNGVQQRNYKWRTMYYNYMIGTFGLRLEQADGNAAGYKPSNQNINELREPQPQDRAYFYTRTSEYANATVYLTKNSGTVSYGATGADSPSGVYLVMTVTDAYGVSHVTNIPVTLDMLTYNDDNVKTKTATDSDKVYSNVNVTYQGVTISSSFKLTVEQKLPENDYPAYPAPGSVDITKELNKEEYNYLETGLTEVNLSLTGIPDASGADVVLVLDNSGSMAYSADPGSPNMPNDSRARRNEMVASIKTMLKKFAETIDGYKSDISVSILTFDGYTLIDGGMFIKKTDGTQNTLATTHNQADTAHFLTPSESLATLPSIENRFIHSSELTDEKIDEIANSFGLAYSGSGTNYDQGLHLAYETLEGKQKLNAQAGTKRNPFLIFMSDGCTWQYNYVGGGSAEGYSTWDNYLNGNLSAIPAASRPSNTARYDEFANSAGKHWMAEAIKGDTDSRYKIINPSGNPEKNYVEWVNGLGAEVFVVGFGMAADNAISRDTAVGVLRRISSGDEQSGHFYDVAKSGQINEVFNEVAMKIRAASGAVFEDKLGAAFDLQMSSTVAGPRGPITLDPRPSVEVYEFITYRADQVGTIVDNVLVTEDMVGTVRPGYESGRLIEQITFNDAGTEAYSTLKSGNILDGNGIINATTFRYNTSKTEIIKIDSNADGVLDYDLQPETFAWLVGDIPQSRYELHYDVYLEGSMEGKADSSESQLTNEYAVLKYKNYIGNDCSITAPKPDLSWEAAEVTYSFYLTNADGQPLNEHGQVVDFKDAKVIEVDAETLRLLLNSTDLTINGNKYLPEGYILYDYNSAYSILAESTSENDGMWNITRTDGLVKSTYVEYGENVTTENMDSLTSDTSNVNFRRTKVWFAVIPNEAKVSYKYYLVNSSGQPIDENGNVVGLADAYVLEGDEFNGSKTFKIGESAVIDSESVALPSKYALYDPAAEYTVKPSAEGTNKGYWQIQKTSGKTETTYVTSAGTHAPTTDDLTDDANVNYRDTTVWFAVYQQMASLEYKYYLVNEAGQPIDAAGNVLSSYKDAFINGLGGTKDFYVNQYEHVDVEDDANVKNSNRYDIFDSAAYYTVYANGEAENKGSWSITSNATPLTTYVESGSLSTTSNTENNENANYRNTTVWFALKLKPATVVYKYYLVNENGDPIDTKGNVISDFKDAQITELGGSYVFSVDNSYTIPVGTPSSKYTVFDPAAEYTVFANGDDANKGYWTIESGNDKKTTYAVSGSVETTEDTTDGANYRNTEVWFALVLPKAKVTYKYYLVNDEGTPINAKGEVLSNFKDAQIADFGASKEFYVGNSAIVNVTDEADIPTAKYTVYDDKAKYTVSAGLESDSTGSWTITIGKTTKTTYVESAGKHNPTLEGTTNNANANYRDTTVWFALVLNEAKVTYKYYLVNINGDPISTSGAVLDDIEAAAIAGLGGSKEFYVDSSSTVDVTDGNVPSKYEIFDPLAKYTVTASSEAKNKGNWKIDFDKDKKKTTYVVSGSLETTEDTEDAANYRDTTVWFALIPKNPVADDTVVIDYGIPVDVDVLANDNGSTLLGYTAGKIENPSLYSLFPTSQMTGFKDKTVALDGEFGTFTITANSEIRYELAEMQMTSFDRITYGANYNGDDYVKGNYYAHLTVIPATIIYYEDDFVSLTVHDYNTGSVKAESWTQVGAENDGAQRDDRVGETLANVYGHDAAYADSSTFSFGSAQKVHIERTDVYDAEGKIESSSGEYAKATFTFAGTGFDIVSYTTNKTGTIVVQVFPYESLDATEASSTPKKSIMVDTYYGYKYMEVPKLDNTGEQIIVDGKPQYEYRWVPAADGEEAGLYQVPVMKVKDLEYGKYKVVITASYSWVFDHGQYGEKPPRDVISETRTGAYDFYLDAIRIYNPANAEDDGYSFIKNAYITDGEYMPEYKELRNILINDVKGFAVSGSNVEGAVFIDNAADSEKQTYTISEYKSYGPNNELYLGKGQAVAFTVNTKGCDSVHIAAKMANGAGKLMIKNVKYNLKLELPIDLETATDMYYDLSSVLVENAKDNIIVLQNAEGDGIISITNLKFTKPATVSTELDTVSAVYMNAKTANAVVDYLNALDAEPEVYSIKTLKRTVKAGRAFTMTVTTNCDADYIVVNGVTFTRYIENRFKNQRTWIVTLTLEEKGMAQIDAYAYSAADVASAKMTTTVKVTKTSAFEGILSGLFGGIFSK